MGAVKNFVLEKEETLEKYVAEAEIAYSNYLKEVDEEEPNNFWIISAYNSFTDSVEQAIDKMEELGGANAWWFEDSEVITRLAKLEEKIRVAA